MTCYLPYKCEILAMGICWVLLLGHVVLRAEGIKREGCAVVTHRRVEGDPFCFWPAALCWLQVGCLSLIRKVCCLSLTSTKLATNTPPPAASPRALRSD
jgi:hypothetical protein